MKAEHVAEICHEANRALCEQQGDFSQPPWTAAGGWARDSAYSGVLFHLDQPDATPAASHESWLAEKRATGWKHGPVKDPANKRHPCMVPFDELPVDQQIKDHLFKGIVDALRSFVGK